MDENWIYTYYANAYAKVKSGLQLKDDVGISTAGASPEVAIATALGVTDAKLGDQLCSKSELIHRVTEKLS